MSGRLGAVKPAANTPVTVYKPASGIIAVVSLSFCNQSASQDGINVAISQSGTPTSTDYVAFGSLVKASGDASYGDRGMVGPFELNGANNDQIVVLSVGGNISFVVTGDEGTA